ncbi:hypothetical protein RCL_jg8345.t1 [Rhizophagus clarus]|uniref:Uncharacterized protein n=1 Tax=Rhizophagus clarus TaxID=94130 RepID=A0A8H3R4J7_9GLOM|nr:hypothetical protein RCL_jg8345.t1 [Rhizophagus clarus]
MYRKIIIASQISCVMKPNIRFPHEWIRDPKSTLCGFGIHRIPFPPTTSIFPFKNIVFISALISGFILFTVSCWSIVFFSFRNCKPPCTTGPFPPAGTFAHGATGSLPPTGTGAAGTSL